MVNPAPIGIFDSGIGGLTVVKEVRQILPQENIIYFGDTARAPYGSRSPAQILGFMHQILTFFVRQKVKMAIFACNTMTALGLEEARRNYPFTLVGMNTGVLQALKVSRNQKIGVIATKATIASGAHYRALRAAAPLAGIYPQACPALVPLIEQAIIEGEQVQQAVVAALAPLKAAGMDTLILGCTHYPFIERTIRAAVGPAVNMIDPARATAASAYEALAAAGQLADAALTGSVRLCVSAGLDRVRQMAGLVMDTSNVGFEALSLADAAKANV